MKTKIKIMTVTISFACALLLLMAEAKDGSAITTLIIKTSGIALLAFTATLWKIFRLDTDSKINKFLNEE